MKQKKQYSKQLISDVRGLLWFISVTGMILGFYCVHKGYIGSLGWVTTLVGLPWAAHATICSLYLQKSKAENTDAAGNGIVFAKAAARGFMEEYEKNKEIYVTKVEAPASSTSATSSDIKEDNTLNSPPI